MIYAQGPDIFRLIYLDICDASSPGAGGADVPLGQFEDLVNISLLHCKYVE